MSLPAYAEIRGEGSAGVSEIWIAELLEVCMYNTELFVYLCWMYWPSELPALSQNLESCGEKELVWSNYFDVIYADCIIKVLVEVIYLDDKEYNLLRPSLTSACYYQDSFCLS